MPIQDQSTLAALPTVIAQTERWLVLSKPAGWLSVPGRGLTIPVISEWAEREHGPTWTVHRLDRETSGVILFARSPEAHREASLWFQNHQIRKGYDCLAQGCLTAPVTRVKEPVGGAPSITQLELKENFGSACLVRAVPLTGRRHQIRVHLASLGHPILGDVEYGGLQSVALTRESAVQFVGQSKKGTLEVGRVALHAARLELPTREVFEAAWPADFAAWVARLRAGDSGDGSAGKGPQDVPKGGP